MVALGLFFFVCGQDKACADVKKKCIEQKIYKDGGPIFMRTS